MQYLSLMRIKRRREKYFGKEDTRNIKQKKLFLKILLYIIEA